MLGEGSGISWQTDFEHKTKVIGWFVEQSKMKNLLIQKFRENGIDSRPFFYSLSEMPVYSKYSFSCKVSKEISKRESIYRLIWNSETIDSVLNQIHDVLRTTVKVK